jgi:hypothetical protein
MTVAELRAKVRELMASGALPSEAPSIQRRGGEESARFALQDPALEPCAICGEPRTQVALFFTGGLMVRLHAACEALWQQEHQAKTS